MVTKKKVNEKFIKTIIYNKIIISIVENITKQTFRTHISAGPRAQVLIRALIFSIDAYHSFKRKFYHRVNKCVGYLKMNKKILFILFKILL